MIQEMADRITVGWSREQLAQASSVEVAAVYLLERMGTAGQADDAKIRNALGQKKAEHAWHNACPHMIDLGSPQNENGLLVNESESV